METGVVVAIAIATYFLFPAHKPSSKETNVVTGWPHLGTCTFLASLSELPFRASLSELPFLASLSESPFLASLSESPFLASLSESPFLALFFTLFMTSIVTVVGGVYFKFIHKKETVAHLHKHQTKHSQWVQTTERRMLFSLVITIPFVSIFIVVSWLASNKVVEGHQEHLRAFLFCELTSCYPEECTRCVRCKCSFNHTDCNLLLRCYQIY